MDARARFVGPFTLGAAHRGVQVSPRLHPHGAIVLIRAAIRGTRLRPRRRVIAGELGSVLPWPPLARARYGRRLAVEAAIAVQADEECDRRVAPLMCQLDLIVAGVEDEEGHGGGGRQLIEQRRHLRDGGDRGRLLQRDALHIDGGGPTLASEAEPGDPLIGPALDDGCTVQVARRVVIEAALWAGGGVAARPHAYVHRVHRLSAFQRMAQQHTA